MKEHKCKICGINLCNMGISPHLKLHKISSKEYFNNYCDWEITGKGQLSNKCCICNNETKFIGVLGGYTFTCSNKCLKTYKEINKEYRMRGLKDFGFTQERIELSKKIGKENSSKMKNFWSKKENKDKMIEGKKKYYSILENKKKLISYSKCGNKNNPKLNYNGIQFRSKGELSLAKFLEENNVKYEYESLSIEYRDSKNKIRHYFPDFYLPTYCTVIECKSTYTLYENIKINKEKRRMTERGGFLYMFDVNQEYTKGILKELFNGEIQTIRDNNYDLAYSI